MSGLGQRLVQERDLWRAVWQHVDAFLDRIESAQTNDASFATTMCSLFSVFDVIERARMRTVGYRLGAATPAVPGGAGLAAGALGSAVGRIPGVEECEFACAPYAVTTDSSGNAQIDDPPKIILERTVQLATFRDIKHGEVTLRTPTYEFGALNLATAWVVLDVGDGGLFPKDERQNAMDGTAKDGDGNPVPANFTAWSTLRAQRLAIVANPSSGSKPTPLSAQILTIPAPVTQAALNAIAAAATGFAGEIQADIATLEGAKTALAKAGVSDTVSGAIAAAQQAMTHQQQAFTAAATAIANHGVPGYGGLVAWSVLLATAEGTHALSGLPTAVAALDAAAASAMDEAVDNRIGYPDGPLRQLRMLQWSLRFFWEHRRGWMFWRHMRVLTGLYSAYMHSFTESLARVLKGQTSGLIYPGNTSGAAGVPLPANTMVGAQILVGATEIPISNVPDLTLLQAGRIAVIVGDRPTAAPVIDSSFDGSKLPPVRFKVPRLAVSVDAGPGLAGTPGLITTGTPIRDHYRALTHAELLRGAHEPGHPGDGHPARAKDGLVQALIAHRSRLALVLGEASGLDRPPAPAIARPYAGIARFALEGTITPQDNRLFLAALPPASQSGTGEQLLLAVPGEMLLLYGKDPHGEGWQTAIEVDRCVIVTGSEAKRDDGTGATPTPACCADDAYVMVIYLRQMYLPSQVTTLGDAFLHRSFAGFGPRSLVTRAMLPTDLDPTTSSTLSVGALTIAPRRDAELEVAWRVLDEWLPKGAPS